MTPKQKTPSPLRAQGAPFLRRIESLPELIEPTKYPFSIPAFSHGIDLTIQSKVTFFVGENGSGKSTLLEALAECCGFNPEGGNRDHHRAVFADRSPLAQALRLSWRPKVTEGFFMRAESFYNFATYLEQVSDFRAYGGKSLHEQSHGESFLALFTERLGDDGLYLLDEPEAALSPMRQLAALALIRDLVDRGSQFIIATHSPILMAYPDADIVLLDESGLRKVAYTDTEHYRVTRDFLNRYPAMLRTLFGEDDEEAGDA
jgi:predicted ATPase